jgi:hypothetical protein
MTGLYEERELGEAIGRLAEHDRASASSGERAAAREIAATLETYGGRVRLEEEQVHGTYWWPLGISSALVAAGGMTRGRFRALALAAAGAALALDEVDGDLKFRRTLLPRRPTLNVVAGFGPEDAARTTVFLAHHDAAHPGLIFKPELVRSAARPWFKSGSTPPTQWGFIAGPALVALGALSVTRLRRAGGLLALAHLAGLVDIGVRQAVPGASDNLTAVAVLLSLARWMQENPPHDRVLLVSTGSEESFMEGMRAFIRRNGSELDPATTEFVCLETLGSPHLTLVRGEGTLRVRRYDDGVGGRLAALAADLDIPLGELRTRNASDGSISARAGYATAMLFSVNDDRVPDNYHWPTDTPENVHLPTVAAAARLSAAYIDRSAGVP